MIKNIIFDWSGTISDDFGVLYEICMELFEEHGVKRVSREQFLAAYALPYMVSINTFLNISKEEWDGKFQALWKERGIPKIIPGAFETLEQLKAKGYRMSVLTSHPRDFINREIIQYFGENKFFESIYAGIYDKKDHILILLKEQGFNAKETVFIGDTTHDIETGKHAGVVTVAVLSGYNHIDKLKGIEPDFIIPDVSKLPLILK